MSKILKLALNNRKKESKNKVVCPPGLECSEVDTGDFPSYSYCCHKTKPELLECRARPCTPRLGFQPNVLPLFYLQDPATLVHSIFSVLLNMCLQGLPSVSDYDSVKPCLRCRLQKLFPTLSCAHFFPSKLCCRAHGHVESILLIEMLTETAPFCSEFLA